MPFQWKNRETESVSVTFAQLSFAFRLEQQGQMGKLWHSIRPAECLIQQHVEGCTGQPFLASDDVSDFHEVVIYDVCQVIGRQFIGTLVENFVVENVTLDDNLTANHVVDMHFYARFYLETHGILCAVSNQLIHFCLGKGQ